MPPGLTANQLNAIKLLSPAEQIQLWSRLFTTDFINYDHVIAAYLKEISYGQRTGSKERT